MKTEFPAQSCTDEAASGVEGAMENEKVDTKEVMHDISCASLELGTHTKKPGQCNCLVAECSRLASRVEELEKGLREIYVLIDGPLSASDKVYCLKLLKRINGAGAHAEEKD